MQKTPTVCDAPGMALRDKLSQLSDLLDQVQPAVVPDALPRLLQCKDAINQFSVRVALIGQVKAGKTALTNGLINFPDLLPSDVNPWTSVITSVHINTVKPRDNRAVFTFFNQNEWDDMVTVGGRLGEAAQRANFEDEFETVQSQIKEMQAKAVQRLGRNFKYLLGSAHNFSGFSAELIKRYVCLGDEDEQHAPEGRFADLTRSADIYIDDDSYPLPTVIRDTPGVNDPFLIRETVTLNSLSDTDICVIVLSAHQAFTSVDIALLRLLVALKHEQIVLFVNRIDELEDPDRQIDEIDGFVRAALVEQGLPADLPIIFGSALWARSTAEGLADSVIERSNQAMDRLVAARLRKTVFHNAATAAPGVAQATTHKTSDLSGLFELQSVIEEKSARAFGTPFFAEMRNIAHDICQQSSIQMRQALGNGATIRRDLDGAALREQLAAMLQDVDQQCLATSKACSEQLLYEMSNAYHDFISAETKAIDAVFAANGRPAQWQPGTEKLRRDLNIAYRAFEKNAQSKVSAISTKAAEIVSAFYEQVLSSDTALFVVRAPVVSPARTPTRLMQSMTIDIAGNWLEKWLLRKPAKERFKERFSNIVVDDMHAMIAEVQEILLADFFETARKQLQDFLNGHVSTIRNLLDTDNDQKTEMRNRLGLETEIKKRLEVIDHVVSQLTRGPLAHVPGA
ncbi:MULTISPECIES: dynamin family protein [unclassified Yoonia]|uniref:dynamin family protein n=1 Tax=unclassified Yoonia TaxID=2629118 RepID=UPI002AFE66DF|nr:MULTISPECIES: dynamin family protein [unclassified Yoonia]